MATYGAGGGRLSAPRKLRTPKHSAGPRSELSIRKGTGSKIVQFSRINTGGDEELSVEEFVSGINYRRVGLAKEIAEDEPKTIEDVPLHAFIDKAYTSCSNCNELIPGNAPRYVVITVTVPTVGAEATACGTRTLCEGCSGVGSGVGSVVSAGVSDSEWKRGLKARQLEVWNRVKENEEKQSVVADSLKMGQGQVSKTLAACAKIRDSYRANEVGNITE